MPNIPDNFYRVSVKALVLDSEKRFLLLKEDNGFWELPGGGLDYGEKPHEGLAREISEEMGLKTTHIADNPSYFVSVLHDERVFWMVNVVYEVKLESLDFTVSKECVEAKFFSKEEALKENIYNNVKEFVGIYDKDIH